MSRGPEAEALEKIKQTQWVKAVKAASGVLKTIDGHQMRVAELALAVCEITRGGRGKEKSVYTLTRFALETGCNFRTLSNWVGIKRGVLDKLAPHQKIDAKYADLVYISQKFGQNPPAAEVRKGYQAHMESDVFERRIIRYMCDLRSLTYNFQKNAATFKVSDETLNEILFFCRSIIEAAKRDRPQAAPIKSGVTKRPRAAASNLIGRTG